ncbi:class Ib ribonucleoside-diphosphate reductase assembly flavoprotein NrdI [Lactobacillus sp. PV034]|uniref:class Ib ribonucleoside-diphosphate reductase assembly flavoprotein NrdI n=1 Tax=Lactobacillus sp. PV034 TaxID=2594495 RepID=UPI00223FB706|nr:class Ib ribonucleoside-diphosphate reductase assembly flavoprotein NrdI [Lactobacillus sp. PV034]QNQ81542.1 class Ib ribonucleoside-diphosphate reductase assembly flavoprotein NrdI [Lactobacillus sp. PV034]
MVAIAYYTITGQTEQFIDKTGLVAHKIDDMKPEYQMGEKYILVLPSYQDFMMDSVVDFITYKDNKKNLIGLIGCGNRNFNDLFAQTAKKISATLNIPILYLLELSGNATDVKNVRDIVKKLSDSTANSNNNVKNVNPPKEIGNISFLSDYRQ